MPPYHFEFTLTPQEAREARRRIIYFRLGQARGVVIYLVFFALFVAIPLFSLFYLLSFQPSERTDHAVKLVIPNSLVLIFCSLLGGSLLRIFTVRLRCFISTALPAMIRITEDGVWINDSNQFHAWEPFTAAVTSRNLCLLTTLSAYLPIPRRLLSAPAFNEFLLFAEAHCLKKSPTHSFPVLLGAAVAEPTVPFQEPSTEPDGVFQGEFLATPALWRSAKRFCQWVRIGRGSAVAAYAVVTASLLAYCLLGIHDWLAGGDDQDLIPSLMVAGAYIAILGSAFYQSLILRSVNAFPHLGRINITCDQSGVRLTHPAQDQFWPWEVIMGCELHLEFLLFLTKTPFFAIPWTSFPQHQWQPLLDLIRQRTAIRTKTFAFPVQPASQAGAPLSPP
jgi:hypothetical protein